MTPKDRGRLRFVAWACVLAVLFAVATPAAAGLPPAILAPPGPTLGEPVAIAALSPAPVPLPPGLVVSGTVAARAPPLP